MGVPQRPARTGPGRGAPEGDPFEGGPLARYRSSHLALVEEVRAALAPKGLLLSDARALRRAAAGPTCPGALAQALDISPAAATDLVDRLEARGLVVRSADPEDRRSTRVALTPAGGRMHRWALGEVRGLFEEITRSLGPRGLAEVERGASALERALARTGAAAKKPRDR
ncbi:MAG: MarR family winged helix-turn-helix transcriptional regulator [Thermoplasmata archaeon]